MAVASSWCGEAFFSAGVGQSARVDRWKNLNKKWDIFPRGMGKVIQKRLFMMAEQSVYLFLCIALNKFTLDNNVLFYVGPSHEIPLKSALGARQNVLTRRHEYFRKSTVFCMQVWVPELVSAELAVTSLLIWAIATLTGSQREVTATNLCVCPVWHASVCTSKIPRVKRREIRKKRDSSFEEQQRSSVLLNAGKQSRLGS